jgi:hypothetical protein
MTAIYAFGPFRLNTSKEQRSGEAELLDGARLIQFIIAGVDFIPLGELPDGVPVATNGGGYAESMAELLPSFRRTRSSRVWAGLP